MGGTPGSQASHSVQSEILHFGSKPDQNQLSFLRKENTLSVVIFAREKLHILRYLLLQKNNNWFINEEKSYWSLA